MNNHSFASIDALRGIAALWVLMYHARGFNYRMNTTTEQVGWSGLGSISKCVDLVVANGWLAVSLFFVISGFCIHAPYVKKESIDLRKYFIRRLIRIWFPYALACLVGFVLSAMAFSESLGELLLSLGLHMFFWIWSIEPLSLTNSSLSGVFRSIVVEVHLYILYAFTWPILKRFGVGRMCLSFLILASIYHLCINMFIGANRVPNIFTPRIFAVARFGEWLLGAWIAEFVLRDRAQLTHRVIRLVSLAGFVFIAICMVHDKTFGAPFASKEMLASIGFAAVVLGIVSRERFWPEKISPVTNRLVQYAAVVGFRSYSIYLFHYPCLAVTGELAIRIGWFGSAPKDSLGGTLGWFLVTVLGVLIGLAVSEIVYRLVELPSHKLARRLAGSGSKPFPMMIG
jgi:peptidoglycan/LPS O-acetylase OafA/YrhL